MDLISLPAARRSRAKAAELVAAFEARFGRAPNGAGARPARPAGHVRDPGGEVATTGETREELLDRVDAQLRADVDGGLAGVAQTVLGRAREQPGGRRRGRRRR